MDELIARLERATGPDRELDRAIREALSGGDPNWSADGKTLLTAGNGQTARFSFSIDYARKLVPEGLNWDTGIDDDHFEGPIFAHASIRTRDRTPISWRARGISPAIALCIVALTVRQKFTDR